MHSMRRKIGKESEKFMKQESNKQKQAKIKKPGK
jgi:hypothetical protein